MGLETVIAGISAVVGVVGGIAQANAASAAAGAQREANAIGAAQTKVDAQQSRRARIREERIRRAQIVAASQNQGVSKSSGELGALGALSTNLGSLVSSAAGQSRAAEGINRNTQRAADFTSQANTIGAWTNTIQQGLDGFQSIFQKE